MSSFFGRLGAWVVERLEQGLDGISVGYEQWDTHSTAIIY
jgi:hypothetical protein